MFNFLCEEATGGNAAPGLNTGVYVILLLGIIMLVVFPMFTQRRKTREYEAMISNIHVGDLVKTIGGIIGRIQNISTKGELTTVILETGSKTEKSYMEFDINTIACVLKSTKVSAEETEEDEEAEEESSEEETSEEAPAETPAETPAEEVAETPAEEVAEPVEETPAEEPKPKKSTTKKSSVKKSKK